MTSGTPVPHDAGPGLDPAKRPTRRRRLGIRGRVVLSFALVMAILLTGAGLAIRSGVADQLTDADDNQLETRAAAVARLLVERGGPEPGLTEGLDDPGESFTQIIGPGERIALNSSGLPNRPLLDADGREDAAEGETIDLVGVVVEPEQPGDDEIDREALEETEPEPFEDDRARVLSRTVTAGGTTYDVIVGVTLEDREDALRALSNVLLVALPLSLLAACLVGWLAIGAALRPVERMRAQASGISHRSIGDRLELPAADDDLRRLAETLNDMLDRLEAAIERERSFVSDASHELRTPLAILRTELELAQRGERSADELREAITSALEETGRLSALADGLLLLARADHDQLETAREPVDLHELAARVAARHGDAVRVITGADPVVVRGDETRLEQALVNLVENAVRHGAAPVQITVRRFDRAGQPVEVEVRDEGDGIPADFLPRAFERFSRADAARTTEGTGLGLSIARTIARAHGGDVRLERGPGGRGTIARLTVLS